MHRRTAAHRPDEWPSPGTCGGWTATTSDASPAGWSEWNGRHRDTVRDFWRTHDGLLAALAAHAEAEYGISLRDRPATLWTVAVLAGLAFAVGAGVPLLAILLAPQAWRSAATILAVVVALSLTALVVASLGGTNIPRTMLRTVSIGLATMLLTYIGGTLLG